MPSAIQNFSDNLRYLRRESELTQDQVAELAETDIKFYQKLEGGRKPRLKIDTVEKFAAVYGVEVWQLLAPASKWRRGGFKKPKPKAAAPRGPRGL